MDSNHEKLREPINISVWENVHVLSEQELIRIQKY